MSLFRNTRVQFVTLFCLQLHILLFLSINISQFPTGCHGCQEQERRALLDFKLSLEDPVNRLSSWLEGNNYRNCCNWQGIGCSRDSSPRVISINLRNTALETYNNEYFKEGFNTEVPIPPNTALHGKFSSSFVNITHLEYLDLGFNNFHESPIPFQFSKLTKLVHLDLSHLNFSVSVSTPFTNLSSLEYLDLSCGISDYSFRTASCLESSSLKWLRRLANLKTLRLSGIDLHEAASSENNFAESVSYLSNLRDLDLSSCHVPITFFPTHKFHNLSRLSYLKLSTNFEINFIPLQLVNFTSLSTLDLSGCGLEGSAVPYLPQLTELDVSYNYDFHPDLTRMFQHQWPKLQRLYIRENDINGSIPSSISNAPMLVSFDASMSDIQGSLPSSVYNLSRLQSLDLSHNNITGCIHSSISNLKSLHILDMSENNIQGSIPKSICQILLLQELSLHHNNITGSLPACISTLRNLTVLDVNENSIGGNVSLISLINELDLTLLNLRSNRLTVVVDQNFHLYSKFKLEYLALPSCSLKGSFPTFICELTHLYHLNLSHNHLTGGIPSCISKFQNLHTFDISNNKLGGPLPPLPSPPFISGSDFVMFPIVTSSSQLSSFDVSNNKLRGEILIESGKRRNSFTSINLARNELSGSIPFSICSKDSESSPQYIDFSNNKLSGVIPTSIGHCSSLVSLNLGSNNLTGSLPREIEQAKGLQYLQLQDNNLDGTLVHFNGKHQGLEVLNLANNRFGGSIIMLLSSYYQLWILSLRSNNFNGSIPHEISHLQSLRILDLSQNDLSGTIPRQIGDLGLLLKSGEYHVESFVGDDLIDIQLQRVIKGIMVQFDKLYRYSSGIDLSCNALEGYIPYEIGLLQGLSSFNLSHNRFSGIIPKSVGNMSSLESLDLSSNKLSGHIPQSLATIDFLGHLNLSFNNLSGRIPRGLHFDTLSGDGLAYANNSLLCGSYTNNICEDDQRSKATDGDSPIEGYEDDKEDVPEKLLLYAIVALGFGVGFWGLFLVLLLKKEKWWFGYWRLVDVVALRVANCFL